MSKLLRERDGDIERWALNHPAQRWSAGRCRPASSIRLEALELHATKDLRIEGARAFAASLRSPGAAAGLAAFTNKRNPRWVE